MGKEKLGKKESLTAENFKINLNIYCSFLSDLFLFFSFSCTFDMGIQFIGKLGYKTYTEYNNGGSWDRTMDFAHISQMLYHWATIIYHYCQNEGNNLFRSFATPTNLFEF